MHGNEYVELRNDAYYLTGTRIGLDVVAHEFQNGRSAESILEAYPSIGSLARVYGAIAFLLEHPQEIQDYLAAQDQRFEEIKARYPIPDNLVERFERLKNERSEKHS
jgi:uncharacterized protein (DUF433 family)